VGSASQINMKNIALTGFMGTGKTSVGRLLAKDLGMTFIDLDEIIEEEAGMSIKDIFEKSGEARFRELERQALRRVISGEFGEGIVLATGGGAVVDEENRALLRGWGVIVCLTASVSTILERTSRASVRPLLERGDRRSEVMKLLSRREEAYRDSDMVLDTTGDSVRDVVRKIRVFLEGMDC